MSSENFVIVSFGIAFVLGVFIVLFSKEPLECSYCETEIYDDEVPEGATEFPCPVCFKTIKVSDE